MNKATKIRLGAVVGLIVLLLVMYWWANRKPSVKVNIISPEERMIGIEINGEKKILHFDQSIKVNRNHTIERAYGDVNDPDGSTVGIVVKNAKGEVIEESYLQ